MERQPLSNSHLGKTDKICRMGGVIFTEAIFARNSRFPKHSHQNACFTLVKRGGYVESFGGKVINAKPKTVIYRPPEASHFNKFGSSDVACALVEIERDRFEQIRGYGSLIDAPFGFANGQIVWHMMRLCREFRETDDVSELVVEGLMLEMIAKATRIAKKSPINKPPRWLIQVKELLNDRFSEKLSLDQIAQTVSVHPTYLANAFREFFNTSIGEYLRQLRIDFSCRKLTETNGSIVEIALAAGFAHQSHFTNTFKRLTGMSPAKYRAVFRKS